MTRADRTRTTRLLAGLGLAAALFLGLGVLPGLRAQGGKSDSEVKVTAKAGKVEAGGKQTITLTLDVNEGWYIYANPVNNEELESAKTVVKVAGNKNVEEVRIAYPPGVVKDAGGMVGKLNVYKKQVSIPLTVRWAGQPEPLEVSVRFMACHEKGQCLLPATVKVKVP